MTAKKTEAAESTAMELATVLAEIEKLVAA